MNAAKIAPDADSDINPSLSADAGVIVSDISSD
jgi:hypothetical protein